RRLEVVVAGVSRAENGLSLASVSLSICVDFELYRADDVHRARATSVRTRVEAVRSTPRKLEERRRVAHGGSTTVEARVLGPSNRVPQDRIVVASVPHPHRNPCRDPELEPAREIEDAGGRV